MPKFLVFSEGLVSIDKIDSILRREEGNLFAISIVLQKSTYLSTYSTEEERDLEFERVKMVLTDSAQ